MIAGKHRKRLYGSAQETTNNRMELTAAIEALNALSGNDLLAGTTRTTLVAGAQRLLYAHGPETSLYTNNGKNAVAFTPEGRCRTG